MGRMIAIGHLPVIFKCRAEVILAEVPRRTFYTDGVGLWYKVKTGDIYLSFLLAILVLSCSAAISWLVLREKKQP
jgi:hypothetical protein